MVERKKWYAVYTRHRWERKVHLALSEEGIDSYCPLNKVQRKWSDRIKTVEEPLFKSYVFVRVSDEQRAKVRMTAGVINFVYWQGKPAIVKDREIETIKLFLGEHQNITVEPLELQPNNKVLIVGGPFIDKEGTVLKVNKHRVKVIIESIGFALIAEIDKSMIRKSRRP